MEEKIEELMLQSKAKDNKIRSNAVNELLALTENKVDWFSEVQKDLRDRLGSENSFQRSIGLMLICNLAKSDMNEHINDLISEILNLLMDEKFITRRQTIQNIWKIAVLDEKNGQKIMEALLKKYDDCLYEDHYNLIRQDILSSLHHIHLHDENRCPLSLIKDLIEHEDDPKMKKKYLKILTN